MADLLRRVIRSRMLVLSAQSLNECYRVITDRRRMMPRSDARRFVEALAPFCTAPSGLEVTRLAWRIQDASGYSWWDCVLLGSAATAGCKIFLSEDMQHERSISDILILNPFRLAPDHEFSP
jgi:predicted nucleic acid-binding protein